MDDPLENLAVPAFDGTGYLNPPTDPLDPDFDEDIDVDCDRGTFGSGNSGGYKASSDLDASDYGGIMVICGGFSVAVGQTIDLAPGVYIIDQGDFDIAANASVTGDGVTIILTSSGADSKIGNFEVNGSADIQLTAPVEAPDDAPGYAGVLFYQDRNVDSGPTHRNVFSGGAELDLEGYIYTPSQETTFQGGSEAGSGCTRLIAKQVTITGDTGLQTNCPSAEDTPIIGKLVASLGE